MASGIRLTVCSSRSMDGLEQIEEERVNKRHSQRGKFKCIKRRDDSRCVPNHILLLKITYFKRSSGTMVVAR